MLYHSHHSPNEVVWPFFVSHMRILRHRKTKEIINKEINDNFQWSFRGN